MVFTAHKNLLSWISHGSFLEKGRLILGIYEELGIKPIINAEGTVTVLGNSLMEPEVLDAMNEAAKHFIDMGELAQKAAETFAEITGAEDGIVTAGAAASLALAAAGCMTGTDPSKVARLPDTAGMKNEIIIQRMQRNPHDHHLRSVGAKLVEVGDYFASAAWEMEAAITERTAAIVYFVYDPQPGVLPLNEVIEIAHSHHLPVIVDAAAELPPLENLRRFVSMGADLVVFSGGKAIAGPSDTGILVGRRAIMQACAVNAFPENYPITSITVANPPRIGRTMKISKEQMVGLIVALKMYAKRNHKADMDRWTKMTEWMAKELNTLPHVRARSLILEQNPRAITIPKTEISLDEARLGVTYAELAKRLYYEEPRVAVAYWPPYHRKIYLNPQCLLDGEEKIVVQHIREILTDHTTAE